MKRTWMKWLAALALTTLAGRSMGQAMGQAQEMAPTIVIQSVRAGVQDSKKEMPRADGPARVTIAVEPAVVDAHPGCASGDCDRGGGAFAELGFAILKPYWSHHPAFVERSFLGGASTAEQTDFQFDGQFVPSIRLGWIGEGGGGVRLGWWGFGNSADAGPSAIDPGLAGETLSAAPGGVILQTAPGESMSAAATLHMDVWDLEFIQEIEHSCWSFLFSGGFRYAYLNQTYSAAAIDAAGARTQTLTSKHAFTGYGMTLAAEVERRLGGGGLAAYSNVRGSFLYGNAFQDSLAISLAGDDVIFAEDAHTRNDRFMPVGELEMGLALTRNMRRGEGFLKLGVVGQVWHEAGNSSRSTNADSLGGLRGGAQDDPNLGLFGVVLRMGLNF
jgi:hypothetical protein